MSESKYRGEDELAARFREALYEKAEPGPARLELERRRLLGRLAAEAAAAPAKRSPAGAWACGMGLAAAFAVAVAAVSTARIEEAPSPPPAAEIIELSGPWRLRPDDAISRGATVRVPRGAGARLELADGSVIWLGPGTQVAIIDGGSGEMRLDAGRLLADVKARSRGSELRIASGSLRVVVRGTVFSVTADDGLLRVRLHRGLVELMDEEGRIDIRPGFEVERSPDRTVSLRPIDATGALGDLLLAGRVAGANGPPVPEIPLPPAMDDAAEAAVELDPLAFVPTAPRRVLPARTPASPRAADPATAPEPTGTTEDAVPDRIDPIGAPAGNEPEDVYLRALDRARAGDLEGSRRALIDYLARFPEGRYWDRVRDILGE